MRLNTILLAMILLAIVLVGGVAYRAYALTVELDQVEITGINFRQAVSQTTSNAELRMTITAILFNDSGDKKIVEDVITLTTAERTHFVGHISPKVQASCAAWAVPVPQWAQP